MIFLSSVIKGNLVSSASPTKLQLYADNVLFSIVLKTVSILIGLRDSMIPRDFPKSCLQRSE